jgi:hypothetical protein
MREISVAVRAENRTMGVFRTISADVLSLGMAFGALDSQTGRTVMQVLSVVRLMTSLKAILATTTATQTAHNVAVGTGAGVQTTLAASTTGAATAQTAQNVATNQGVLSQIAHKIALVGTAAAHYIHAAGAWIATTAQNALNISYATFLALTGVGIAVIVAAAAAMWYFASQMNAATASVQSFNSVAAELPSRTRSIQRAGEAATTSSRGGYSGEAALYRRGIE